MAKAKGRASLFEDVDGQPVQEYDPEGQRVTEEHGSDSESNEDAAAATGHYVKVGKSTLRSKENVSLGPQYRGSRVSRDALDQESSEGDGEEDEDEEIGDEDDEEDDTGDNYNDPEHADLAADTAQASDSDIDSDNALADSDADKLNSFVFWGSKKPGKLTGKTGRVKASDYMSGSEAESDTKDGLDELVKGVPKSGDEDQRLEDDEEEDDQGDSEDDQQIGSSDDEDEPDSTNTRPALGAFSSNADVDKGRAIQQQRRKYDALLNLRIRLQKALIAANTFPALEPESPVESEPYEAAEEAAVKLLNTISSLRDNMAASAHTGEKRKRGVNASMPSSKIWSQLEEEDGKAIKFRQDRLEKWSRKVQSVNVQAPKGLSSRNKTLIGSLQEQLDNPDSRLLKRTRVPRSCAPAQAASKTIAASDEDIYDDADFYQLLLKELVDQRTVESLASSTAAVPSVMLTAAKEAKARKNVDRKASKGRKMRFTVHEKLQNFMAPEDRRSWEQGAIDRFFATLFGRRMELNEADSEDSDEELAEEGLRLFRS